MTESGTRKAPGRALSGQEIVESVVDAIRKHLGEDCLLAGHLCYEEFFLRSASWEIELRRVDQAVSIRGRIGNIDGRLDSSRPADEASQTELGLDEVRSHKNEESPRSKAISPTPLRPSRAGTTKAGLFYSGSRRDERMKKA
jgi:hypothetical protein